jgi:hypothetical protein
MHRESSAQVKVETERAEVKQWKLTHLFHIGHFVLWGLARHVYVWLFASAAASWAAAAGRCRRTQGQPRAQQVRAGAVLVRCLVSFPITRRS